MVIPQLPQNLLSILPLAIEHIFALLKVLIFEDRRAEKEEGVGVGVEETYYKSPFGFIDIKQWSHEFGYSFEDTIEVDEIKLAEFINFSIMHPELTNKSIICCLKRIIKDR